MEYHFKIKENYWDGVGKIDLKGENKYIYSFHILHPSKVYLVLIGFAVIVYSDFFYDYL